MREIHEPPLGHARPESKDCRTSRRNYNRHVMKKFLISLCAGALLLPAVLFAANFEGKVTYNMTMPNSKETMPMTMSVKEGFSRTDMTVSKGMTTSMIMDQAKQQTTILMPEQKMYMVQPMPKQDQVADKKDTSDVTLQKTGETAKIAGYTATKYIAKSKDSTSEIWATEELGTYLGMGGGGAPGGGRGRGAPANNNAWEKALVGKNFFPLRMVVLGADGKEAMRMEAISVEKQSLPSSVFAAPADYQNIGDMMKGGMGDMMKGMMPGR
jgi:hypothetical protein